MKEFIDFYPAAEGDEGQAPEVEITSSEVPPTEEPSREQSYSVDPATAQKLTIWASPESGAEAFRFKNNHGR